MIKSRAGFTLIEMIVALFILAMIGVTLMTTLSSALDAKDRIAAVSDRYHLARAALFRMAQEISMAYLSGNRNYASSVVQPEFRGEANQIAFDAFGNVVTKRGGHQSDQQEISYFLAEDPKTKQTGLYRRHHANLTRNLGTEGRVELLCPYVKTLQFRYWDDALQNWATDWSTMGVAQKVVLPSRVELSFSMTMEDGSEQTFMTETEIWLVQPVIIR